MITSRYATAQTAPMDSGLYAINNDALPQRIHSQLTYIVTFFVLLISTPFKPASMNVFPSHLIRLYANANAMPLKASEAISGSPLPRKLLYKITTAANVREKSVHVSVLDRLESMVYYKGSMVPELIEK